MNVPLQRCHVDHTGGGVGVKSQFWWSIKMRFWRKANPWKSKYGRKAFTINYRSSGQSLEGMIAAFLSSTFPLFLCCGIIFLGPFFFYFPLRLSATQRHKCTPLSKVHPIVCLPSVNLSTPRCLAECVYLVRQWQVMVMASITELVLSHR